ncbi:hypothetical protein F5Y10DRAFT_266307 [Nemania abortiva]|nr:hypothetical protein F5Y10DRAFT_266307 [Nemania abortiva]
MENDRAFQAGLQAWGARRGNAPARLVEPLSPQLETPREQGAKSVGQMEDANTADNTNSDSGTTSSQQLEEPINLTVHELLISRLKAEREEIVKQVVHHLLPQVERVAAAAAEREIDRLIESAAGETTREKIQAILGRINELSEDELETVFLRNSVMATALRTVLQKAELEDALAQWEDLHPGD